MALRKYSNKVTQINHANFNTDRTPGSTAPDASTNFAH